MDMKPETINKVIGHDQTCPRGYTTQRIKLFHHIVAFFRLKWEKEHWTEALMSWL